MARNIIKRYVLKLVEGEGYLGGAILVYQGGPHTHTWVNADSRVVSINPFAEMSC